MHRELDLGVNTDLGTLNHVADPLRMAGFEFELREPDGQDPIIQASMGDP